MTKLKTTRTRMQTEFSLPGKIIITSGIFAFLIFLVVFFKIPNPNMILIAGLVFCSAMFGFGGGIPAALIMLLYSLYFFSTDHSMVRFTEENATKVIISLIGIAADMLLVCTLKKEEVEAFSKVNHLTEELQRENRKLQDISYTDGLTGLRNRQALRRDYDSYEGHETAVIMMDLNDFKVINDTMGHAFGDKVLKETGKLLSDTFGHACCYRYGGDEFLMIVPGICEADLQTKLSHLRNEAAKLTDIPITFSIGSVRRLIQGPDALREMISEADQRMYAEKRSFREEGEASAPEESGLHSGVYTVQELRAFLNDAKETYAIARVVDPIEGKIIDLLEDGSIRAEENCYGIWESSQKCLTCSSTIACKTGRCETKVEQFQDNVYHIQSNPITLTLNDGSFFSAVVELVTRREENEVPANNRADENIGNRAAHYLAKHDSLTHTLNADAFYEYSRTMIGNRPGTDWVMVTANIMNFRLVNSLFGDLKGNEVLIRTASLLRGIAQRASGLCGRLGGDQFALLLPKETFREVSLLNTEKILAKAFNSGMYTFIIHFGVCEIEDPAIPISVMCGRANSALRTIRESHTRFVAYFNDDIKRKLLLEQAVIGGFEQALENNEFQMYLQPLCREDGTAMGAEALVRWQKKDGSLIMPCDFIETLEQAGMIQKLDLFMWELAVKQLSRWKQENLNLTISVNMSALDFYSVDVYRTLTDLLERYDVDSRNLRLEITETALLVDPVKSSEVVSRLRERGFVVEVDDFGKGYSSLSLLKTIRADILKIDMHFLQEIQEDRRSALILRSIIQLAESLGMNVIAEGVETEEQLHTLTEMGCAYFQGYYFSRPIPVRQFEENYLNHNKG